MNEKRGGGGGWIMEERGGRREGGGGNEEGGKVSQLEDTGALPSLSLLLLPQLILS